MPRQVSTRHPAVLQAACAPEGCTNAQVQKLLGVDAQMANGILGYLTKRGHLVKVELGGQRRRWFAAAAQATGWVAAHLGTLQDHRRRLEDQLAVQTLPAHVPRPANPKAHVAPDAALHTVVERVQLQIRRPKQRAAFDPEAPALTLPTTKVTVYQRPPAKDADRIDRLASDPLPARPGPFIRPGALDYRAVPSLRGNGHRVYCYQEKP